MIRDNVTERAEWSLAELEQDPAWRFTLTAAERDHLGEMIQKAHAPDRHLFEYNADEEQTDSTPTITASGERVREGICALSRDIEQEFGLEFGDKIFINGYGEFEFQDRMNKRIKKGVDL